jgi:hypothetical protein
MRKALTALLASAVVLVVACGGDDGESSASNDDFCSVAELVAASTFGSGREEAIEGMRAVEPPGEIADEWEVVIGIYERFSPASTDAEREAFEVVVTFFRDECGIDLSAERDPVEISYDCSTDERPESEPGAAEQAAGDPVRIVESGFCTYPLFPGETRFGIVIQNTTDETLTGMEVTVDALDSSGTKVNPSSRTRGIDVLRPGQELGIAGFFQYEVSDSLPEVARLDVQIEGPDEDRDLPPSGELVVSDVSTTLNGPEDPGDLGSLTTTFTVASSYEQRMEDLPVSIIYRNAEGEIVGGYRTSMDALESGDRTTTVVEDIGYFNPAVTQAEVYVQANV